MVCDYKCDLTGIGNKDFTDIDENFTDCTVLLTLLDGHRIEASPAPIFCFALLCVIRKQMEAM